jgi:3,4-dihydroxy 2-butanone 4-phosphate synthase/GTP cyclohydrolase II
MFDDGPYVGRWPQLLAALEERSIRSLMVEGGSNVITSLLESGCVHHLSLTIAPRLLAGLHAVRSTRVALPALHNVRYRPVGGDLIVEAEFAPPA